MIRTVVTPAADLEARIRSATARLARAKTPLARAVAWKELSELVKQRTPEQVARMERAKGLV